LKLNKKINIFEPDVGLEELAMIKDIIQSKWIGKGQKVELFEKKLAALLVVSNKQLLTTTSATEAIFSICERISLKEKDEVIMPSISFIGMANAVSYFEARPIFIDVEPETLQLSESKALEAITGKTKAIILNHYGGYATYTQEFINELRNRNIVIIEDSACAFLAKSLKMPDQYAGTVGDYGIWSFDSMKIVTTGDGGLIYAKNYDDIEWLRKRNYFGLSGERKSGFDKSKEIDANWWEFDISYPGRRAIMNDLAAGIGLVQLEKIDLMFRKRREIIATYIEILKHVPEIGAILQQNNFEENCPYLFWIQINNRDELARYLLSKNIYSTFRYYPLHQIPHFNHDSNLKPLENSVYAAKKTLNLPLHSNLSISEVEYISNAVIDFVKNG
jgi:dTDP-4-amino-4,6-dideoxygalactose transaminase